MDELKETTEPAVASLGEDTRAEIDEIVGMPTGEGTGLGLSISWDIVTQQHCGTIAVDSRVGEFTEFTIRLPRVRG